MKLSLGETADVIMFDKDTNKEIFSTTVTCSDIEYSSPKSEFIMEYQGTWEATGQLVSGIKDIINVQHLANLLLGEYHWVHNEVDRLDRIRKRTKKDKIKNKLRKRIVNLIMEQSLMGR